VALQVKIKENNKKPELRSKQFLHNPIRSKLDINISVPFESKATLPYLSGDKHYKPRTRLFRKRGIGVRGAGSTKAEKMKMKNK